MLELCVSKKICRTVLGLIFATAGLCFFGFPVISECRADEIIIDGVKLPVTEFRPIDAKVVKLVVGSTAEVLTRDQAELRTIELTFASPSVGKRFSPESLTVLIKKTAMAGPTGAKAFSAVMAAFIEVISPLESDRRQAAIRLLTAQPAIVSALNTTSLTRFTDSNVGLELLGDLATIDPTVFAIRSAGIPQESKGAIAARLMQNALSAIELRDFERAASAARALATLSSDSSLPSDVPDARDLTIFVQRLTEALDISSDPSLKEANPQKIFEVFDSTSTPAYRTVLYPFLVDAVHREAKSKLEAGNPGAALQALARLPLNKCTQTTHRLLEDTLGKLQDANAGVLLNERLIRQFLYDWAAIDKGIAGAVEGALIRVSESTSNGGDPGSVNQLLNNFSVSDAAFDRIKRAQTFGYLRLGLRQSARESALAIHNYTLADTLRFTYHGLYAGGLSMTCYAVSAVLLIILLSIKARGYFSRRDRTGKQTGDDSSEQDARVQEISDSGEEEEVNPDIDGGFTIAKARMMSPMAFEYRKLMAVFGLSPTADLKEIKQAYRKKVKSVHPDLNPNISGEARSEFIQVTQTYERLLALREEIGL